MFETIFRNVNRIQITFVLWNYHFSVAMFTIEHICNGKNGSFLVLRNVPSFDSPKLVKERGIGEGRIKEIFIQWEYLATCP